MMTAPARKQSLAPDDLFALRFLRDAKLSPDADRVAYCLSSTESGVERLEIRLRPLSKGEEVVLPFCGVSASWPRWSPDGRALAFVGDGRLWIVPTDLGAAPRALTPPELMITDPPSWSPDGQRIVVASTGQVVVDGNKRLTSASYRGEGIGFLDGFSQSLHILDVADAAIATITTADQGCCTRPAWSPDGRNILFFASADAIPLASYSPRLMLYDVMADRSRTLLGGSWFIEAASWLPSGERIALAGSDDQSITIPNPSLWCIDLDGTLDHRMMAEPARLGGIIHHDMPSWDLTVSNAIQVIDDERALVTDLRHGRYEIVEVALAGPQRVVRPPEEPVSRLALDVGRLGKTLLVAEMSLHHPPELTVIEGHAGPPRRLTCLNTDLLASWPDFEVDTLRIPTVEGWELDGWFLRKRGQSGPLPTVLFIHGGPFSSTGHGFRYDLSMLAAAGLGVLFANFRGSAGYGDDFSRAIMGDWGGKGFPDHMATVNLAVALGLADGERLGVWGPSHGGFATSWVIGHSTRFRAAVVEAGICNLVSAYYVADMPETMVRDIGGRPDELPDLYRATSPLTFAPNATTPTLFIHGEDDLRCPISEAEQMHRALCDAGCRSELLRIADCNHLGDSCGPLPARFAQNEALLDWFVQHLLGVGQR